MTEMFANILFLSYVLAIPLQKFYFVLFSKNHLISPTPITASAVELKVRIDVSIPGNDDIFPSVP